MYQAGLERPGTMAAILGLAADQVEAACADAADAGVVRAANLNAPGQVVISGERPAVERACALARERGARRAIVLEVSGAFHSPLMGSAAAGLAEALAEVTVHDALVPVVANVSAEPLRNATEIRLGLEAQLLGAVRWEDSMRRLVTLGAQGFVWCGLLRSLDQGLAAWNVEDPESLQGTLQALASGIGSVAPPGTGPGSLKEA